VQRREENTMNLLKPMELTTLRNLLTHRLAVLRDEVAAAENTSREAANASDHDVIDRKEEASIQQMAELDSAQEERDRDEIAQVEAALQRLSTGSYGQCVDCGEAIVLPRLMVQPQAQRCAPCQLGHERAELRSR
jgi:DnaK suppressor protein